MNIGVPLTNRVIETGPRLHLYAEDKLFQNQVVFH